MVSACLSSASVIALESPRHVRDPVRGVLSGDSPRRARACARRGPHHRPPRDKHRNNPLVFLAFNVDHGRTKVCDPQQSRTAAAAGDPGNLSESLNYD